MEKINIAELLKDCPKGIKLYSPLCGECIFDRLNYGTIICKKQNKPIYIQVSYLLASEETIEREFKPLKNIQDNYPKYVITMDDADMSHDGIIHLNLIDFLMDNEVI